MPAAEASLRSAAWAGLQDSMPRAALLSLHARVRGIRPLDWEDPSLVQVWGPRFSAYVVAEADAAVFTLGRLPAGGAGKARAERTAERLEALLDGRRMACDEAGHAMGVDPNALRYATATGRLRIRWDGARQPEIWMTPPPAMPASEARLELARRHLHVFGPSTAESFAAWAGVHDPAARAVFAQLAPELVAVRTPVGEAWILASDESSFRARVVAAAEAGQGSADEAAGGAGAGSPPVRFLPSGDPYFLLQGADRTLLVPDPARRAELWTPRVWPGALLVSGEIAGVWRRSEGNVLISPWRRLSAAERAAVESEAATLPLPGLRRAVAVTWMS